MLSLSQAKGNRDKQSLIPTTIKQLKNAVSATNGEASFTVDGADLHQITIVGLITSADEQSTNLQYNVDDGTDQITVKMWCASLGGAPRRDCCFLPPTLPCTAHADRIYPDVLPAGLTLRRMRPLRRGDLSGSMPFCHHPSIL